MVRGNSADFFLLRFRPQAVPLPAIILAQALNLIALASTIFIQIPIQIQFGESGFSAEAHNRLLETDPIRWVSLIAKILIYVWAMFRLSEVASSLPISSGILRAVKNETSSPWSCKAHIECELSGKVGNTLVGGRR